MELPTTPLPDPDDLDRLAAAVRAAGGSDRPEPHLGAAIPELDVEDFDPAETCGCGHATLFILPGEDGLRDALTACAVCDGATRWPRLA
jgi:hypothetical protein